MTIRREIKEAQMLNDRINELYNRRIFLRNCKDELLNLEKKFRAGDKTVASRIRELFDIIDKHNEWIARNLPIIKARLAS